MKKTLLLFLTLIFVLPSAGCGGSGNNEGNGQEKYKALQPYVMLNSGYKMPVLGLGTWTQNDATAAQSVYEAIKDGYRLIDTALYYGNQVGVGKGVRRAIDDGLVTREEVFVTSKILSSSNSDVDIDECNAALGLDYIDLMLIHQPGSNDEATYKALEQGVRSGKIRSIGISNYYTPEAFERINRIAEIPPAVVQNENHLYYQNTVLQEYVKRYGTVIESWYPFGGRGHTAEHFSNAAIKAIAEAHGKTPAQVILRWHIQAGYVTIPGSSNPAHIAENINIFDFVLTDAEMREIVALNKNQRYENW